MMVVVVALVGIVTVDHPGAAGSVATAATAALVVETPGIACQVSKTLAAALVLVLVLVPAEAPILTKFRIGMTICWVF